LVENVIWEEGLAETSEYRHIGGGGIKLLKKTKVRDFKKNFTDSQSNGGSFEKVKGGFILL